MGRFYCLFVALLDSRLRENDEKVWASPGEGRFETCPYNRVPLRFANGTGDH